MEGAKTREEKYRHDSKENATNGHNGRRASGGSSVKKLDTSMWEKQIAAAEREGKPAVPLPSQKVMRKKSEFRKSELRIIIGLSSAFSVSDVCSAACHVTKLYFESLNCSDFQT